MNTTDIGDKSEAIVLTELIKQDLKVLKPFGNNRRYDIVIENDIGDFLTVQVKTGRLKNGVITFKTGNRVGHYRHIDFFAVYCPETEKVYMVPTRRCGVSHGYLRTSRAKNGQIKGVLVAQNFELDRYDFANNMEGPEDQPWPVEVLHASALAEG